MENICRRVSGTIVEWACLCLLAGVLLAGCANDLYLRHPETSDAVRCQGAPLGPGLGVRHAINLVQRNICTDRWKDRGYLSVKQCENAPGAPGCLTEEEKQRAKLRTSEDYERELREKRDAH